MYVYRFINQYNKIIYIGRTNNVIRRLRNEHFTDRGHLPEACYNETVTVEVATTTSPNEAKIYELYYIEKFHPKYNQADIGSGNFSFELQDLTWETFDFHTDKNSKTKQEMTHLLATFHTEIEMECQRAERLLRHKDRSAWLTKLSLDERNEYLRVIYSLDRFVQNIANCNDRIKQEMLSDQIPKKEPYSLQTNN